MKPERFFTISNYILDLAEIQAITKLSKTNTFDVYLKTNIPQIGTPVTIVNIYRISYPTYNREAETREGNFTGYIIEDTLFYTENEPRYFKEYLKTKINKMPEKEVDNRVRCIMLRHFRIQHYKLIRAWKEYKNNV